MPYKDPEVRRAKAREYTRAYKARMSPEKKEEMKAKQRETKKREYNEWLRSLSPEERQAYYDQRNAAERAKYAADPSLKQATVERGNANYHRNRNKVIEYLGGRCSSPDCKWINEDGTRGCTDKLCLQVDHVHGDGKKLREAGEKGSTLYIFVLRTKPGEIYQLLCANCNWIKRHKNREVPKPRFAKAGA